MQAPNPITYSALLFLMTMGIGTKLCVGTNKLFSFTVFLFSQFSPQASPHPILSIMEALVTEPYSVTSHLLHKLSSRQPDMLLENRLLLVCNIHEENQHGCQCTPEFNYSAKPVLWGEEPSFVHISELVVWAHRHLPETCDGLFIQRLGFHITHTYTHTVVFFRLIASRHCVEVCGTIRFLTKNNVHTDMQRMDAKTRTCWRRHADMQTSYESAES